VTLGRKRGGNRQIVTWEREEGGSFVHNAKILGIKMKVNWIMAGWGGRRGARRAPPNKLRRI